MRTTGIQDIDVSRETIEALEHFASLAAKWTKRINLIAPSTVGDIWNRHIVDSAQLMPHVPPSFDHWVDLGSGGGFPGIVIAAIAKKHMPNARFTLIESDHRKCAFLRNASRELDLNVNVISDRIDNVSSQQADIVSARALSSLNVLLEHIHHHIDVSGTAILHKGRKWAKEVHDARVDWTFDIADYPSMTDAEARIIKLNRISRV